MKQRLIQKVRSLLKEPVGILGFGVEGQSTCRFLLRCGIGSVTVFDKKPPDKLPNGAVYAGEKNYLSKLLEVNTLCRSPGIRADVQEIRQFENSGGTLTSQTKLIFQLVPREKIIGVTGTLGKGTCCSLLKKMLDKADIAAVLGGNIGNPALDLLEPMDASTLVILELSSFQLSTLRCSACFAIVLRTSSEHLDWHISREEYWDHKANLVRCQKEKDLTVYCEDSPGSKWIAGQAGGQALGFGNNSPVRVTREKWSWKNLSLSFREHAVPGSFNLENVAAAAVIAEKIGAPANSILAAARSFKGLEHRLEQVGSKMGLKFYNDSYATRPEATIGAL